MSRTTIATALDRIARLTPVNGGPLKGDGAYVCSPAFLLPSELQELQRRRTDHYLTTGDRTGPGEAPAYVVTYRGHLLAWVTLDGATHYAGTPGEHPLIFTTARELSTMLGHRHAIALAWGDTVPLPRI